MKTRLSVFIISLLATFSLQAQTNERYIEVTGTSEIEIVPDRIHYLIEIREYFEEEFDGKSKPEEYRTKVPLAEIEQGLREAIAQAGIPQNAIRTEEIGDYWRQQGQDFLVSKKFDITLTDFNQINEIVKHIDTKGIHTMRIGELENKDILAYHQKGKIEALKAAQRKATYLVEALGKRLGNVIRIVEEGSSNNMFPFAQSNVLSSDASSFDNFRTIKKNIPCWYVLKSLIKCKADERKMPYSSFRPLYLCIFASVRVTQTSKAMQTTAIRTVAKSLPQNKVILLTCLISNSYIPYTDLRKISGIST